MNDSDSTIVTLRDHIRAFVRERDWEQFHNPKDLAGAIAIEAAELMELFLWKTPGEVLQARQDTGARQRIEEELADVLILCFSLANQLEIDVTTTLLAKLAINAAKYPAERARGNAAKYTAYSGSEDVIM
jgi:dCTP diphosphatase